MGGGGQTNLRGLLNRRGPLWDPGAPHFCDLPVSTSGILGVMLFFAVSTQFFPVTGFFTGFHGSWFMVPPAAYFRGKLI